jgi:serine/threonine protein kinase
VGSLFYMAPEVLLGRAYNEAVDVFSYAVILYELFTGNIIATKLAVHGRPEEMLDYAGWVDC